MIEGQSGRRSSSNSLRFLSINSISEGRTGSGVGGASCVGEGEGEVAGVSLVG